MIQPREVPRLPVLDWQGFGLGGIRAVPSIIDGSAHFFTSSGRAAIMLGLELLGVQEGDQVLVPTYHCPTMVAPIIAVGAEPVFYPINDSGEALLENVMFIQSARVKAAIVPHFFGIPQDLSAIRAFCDRHSIALIEDCAHCFFGTAGKRVVGHWGDIAVASLTKFFPVTSGGILAFPQGGAVRPKLHSPGILREFKAAVDIVETAAIAGRLWGAGAMLKGLLLMKRSLRRKSPDSDFVQNNSSVVAPEALGFDVTLVRQAPERICRWMPVISKCTRIAECRRDNYRKLARALSGHRGFSPLIPTLPETAVPYVFPLRVDDPDGKYQQLKSLGLPVFRWNWLWPGTPSIEGDFGLVWSSEVFQLACHQDLTDEELECICSTVIRTCSTSGAGRR
jgi:dTDP-4-amino-4,6-dideoxygalactose transaminase